MGKAKKCSQRTSDGAKKTCHRSYGEARSARERLRLEGRDVEIYPHDGHFHLRSKRGRLYVVPSPVKSPRKPRNGSAHRGGTKRGSIAPGKLSGALARVRPGEGQGVGSDSSSRGLRQGVKSKRDKSLNPLTAIKIMCYNPGFLKTDISDIYLMSEILRFMMIFHHIADITNITDKRYKTDLLDKMDKSEMSDISDLIPPYTTNPPHVPTGPECRILKRPYTRDSIRASGKVLIGGCFWNYDI